VSAIRHGSALGFGKIDLSYNLTWKVSTHSLVFANCKVLWIIIAFALNSVYCLVIILIIIRRYYSKTLSKYAFASSVEPLGNSLNSHQIAKYSNKS